jgi:hypothetical protein
MKLIATALVKAQKAFGPALKESVNPAFQRGGKGGKYADLASCINAVMDSLNNNGIALIQQNQPHPDGVLVETVFIHESGEMLNCGQIFVPASKQDPQGYGSALTYARRYSLMAACGIAPEDDDGNAASKPTTKISATQGEWDKLTPDRQAVVQAVLDSIMERVVADDIHGAYENYTGIEDQEEKIALWSKLDSKVRSAIKKQAELAKENK